MDSHDLIQQYLERGASLALSISGGKDGQAMCQHTTSMFPAYQKQMFLIHADLGLAEWPQTPSHVEWHSRYFDLPLHIVSRQQGDLVQRIADRKAKTQYFWPSSKQRYCTSDNKRNPINKHLRKYSLVISCEGIRAEESPARARKPSLEIRKAISSTYYKDMTPAEALDNYRPDKRLALTWYPIFHWTLEQVFGCFKFSIQEIEERRVLYKRDMESIALLDWSFHHAYVIGNQRLSCAICVLACDEDLKNGAKANPELASTYLKWEEETGITFKNSKSLKDILNSS